MEGGRSTTQLIEMSQMMEEECGEIDIGEYPDEIIELPAARNRRKFSAGVRIGSSWTESKLNPPGRNESDDTLNGAETLYNEICQDPLEESLDKKAFQSLVEVKKKKYHLGQRAAEIEVILDKLIEQHNGSQHEALIAVVSESSPQSKVALLVSKLLSRGADVAAVDKNSRTPLHYAVKRGFSTVAERLLEAGASPNDPDIGGVTPLSIAHTNSNDKLTALLIQHIKSSTVREMFSKADKSSSRPVFSLHDMIEKNNMKLSVVAVLDSMVESVGWTSYGSVVNYSLLEADRQGFTPDNDNYKISDKTCLQLIAQTSDPDYISHPVVRLLVRRKWTEFARTRFTLSAAMYLVAMLFLTSSVILALNADDPSVYDTNSAEDMARAACESVIALFIATTLIQEVFEAIKLGKDYFSDWFNYLDLAASVMMILVIPLRFLQLPAQWGVYSMGYLLSIVRVFKFSAISRRLRAYSQIIWRMTTREFVDFLLMFAVIMLAFTGSFAMALRLDGTLASTNNIRTSDFWNILLTSSRVLIEDGPVLKYFDDSGHVYGWYATLLFLTFLFVSMVMLMNILIAQLSDTYESMRRNAQLEVDMNRAWIVARVELNTVAFCCRPYRLEHYVDSERVTSEQLAKFQTEKEYRQDSEKQISDMQLQLHDVDLSARSIRNRQRNQDEVLGEILALLKDSPAFSKNNNS